MFLGSFLTSRMITQNKIAFTLRINAMYGCTILSFNDLKFSAKAAIIFYVSDVNAAPCESTVSLSRL